MTVLATVLLALIAMAAPVAAQDLVWAGDAEGGAPYVMPDPRNPARTVGFEVDIAEALGTRLGRRVRFQQNQWDGLVPGLERGEYDIVLNGLEITPERAEKISFSTPYYYSTLTLTERLDETRITRAEDLRGKTVGTLKASFAERYLESLGQVTIRSYDGQANPYMDMSLGRLDAVVMDTPIAIYYAYGPQYRNIELNSVRMMFGIAVRKTDASLLADLDQALESMKQDGTLKRIYQAWGIYNPATALAFGDDAPLTNEGAPRYREFIDAVSKRQTLLERLRQYGTFLPLLMKGALITIELSVVSMAIAILLGITLAMLRVFGNRLVAWPIIAFIEVIRGTPLLIQLFIIFYGLPAIGLRLSPFIAAVAGLGLNYAAYEAENYRAGIQSIPTGQMDAALALGLSRWQTIRKVVLPQAIRLVIPPVTNDFIALLKDSSLVSVITMEELTKVYGRLASTYYDYIGIGLLTAAIYFLLGLPIARLSRILEKRLAYMRQ